MRIPIVFLGLVSLSLSAQGADSHSANKRLESLLLSQSFTCGGVMQLLHEGARFSSTEILGGFPIHKMLRYGMDSEVGMLAKKCPGLEIDFTAKDRMGSTVLHYVSEPDLAGYFLTRYPWMIEAENNLGETPAFRFTHRFLRTYPRSKDFYAWQKLLTHLGEAPLEHRSQAGETPFEAARRIYHLNKFLVEYT